MRGRTLYIIVAGVVVLAVLAVGVSMTARGRDRARFLENREVTGWEKAGMASDMIGLMTPDIRGASIIPQRDRDAKLIEEILGVIDTEYANSHAVPSYRGFPDVRAGRPDSHTVRPPPVDEITNRNGVPTANILGTLEKSVRVIASIDEVPALGTPGVTRELEAGDAVPKGDMLECSSYDVTMDARDGDGLWEERRREFQAPAQSEPVSGEASPLDISPEDPIPGLLGKSLGEIEQAMGRPDDSGHSDQFGPHYYILFQSQEGSIRFSSPQPVGDLASPESVEDPQDFVAESVLLEPGREVMGVEVGAHFSEIIGKLGEPDFGPESGLNGLYHIDYLIEDPRREDSQILVSFSAESPDSPTLDCFVKLEPPIE